MPRHSKNNTALSFFTYAESKALEYGTKKQRLGRDSMREYDSCYLCLQRARDPVCCTQGHLYCRECILENILAQKKEILRQQKLLEAKAKDEEEDDKRKAELAKEAVIQEFERQQVRITPIKTNNNGNGEVKSKVNGSFLNESNALGKKGDVEKYHVSARIEDSSVKAIEWTESFHKDKKRKFQIDEEQLAAIAKREQDDALKKLEEERPKLPNFWLPSLTPSADPDKAKQVKQQTMCTAADPEHSISMKSLIPTKFTEDKDPTSKKINLICPSCRKTLTNSLKICLMKPCGHVICKICVDRLVRKTKQCFVCDAKCRDKDIADMSGEGTGFASGGGKVVAERFDVAFQ
ncbi:10469_t:CDS:2 [Funneliformis mosseae]|uniref:10469_t:CDS:1 n=1 Tax=Funneliformis mosseae TaxID=27381 RepID=A0A9N8V1V7_FUNMO|nr:10469_t:CDS:2 [Funneliformis mosseae]